MAFTGCRCGTAEVSRSQLLLWRWPELRQVWWESFCHVWCRKESQRVIDPVTEFHPFPLQQVHAHACRPHVRSQKESPCCGTRITLMAFLPQWAFTLSSGNVIPTSLEGRGSFYRSSHFLPASAEEEVDTLVLCSDKPERGSHPAARTRCEICLVTDWTGFLFNPLQMMRRTDICQVPFPHISPASTSSLSVIIWI